MIVEDDVIVGIDGSNLIPIQFGSTLVSTPRVQSSTVIDLGRKLLHSAREGKTNVVMQLMEKGAPFSSDWLGTTPLHLAAMNDHLKTCEILLKNGISRDARTKVERTPLHLAAYEGHDRVCRLLLDFEAEVDCRDMLQMTPLHWAVEKGHEKCVDVLLEYGADPNVVSKFHRTPLSIAAEFDQQDFVDKLQMASINKQKYTHCANNSNDSQGIDEIIVSPEKSNDITDISDNNDVQTSFAELLPKVSENANEATLQLLRDHGITMLPTDTNNTVTSALQSGRTIVLSDAGKLLLQETNPKQIQIKKKPLILPANKLRNTKVYTLSSSQLLALTAQNKHTIQKIPISAIKKATTPGLNFIQVSKGNQVFNFAPHKSKISKIAPIRPVNNNNNITVSLANLNRGGLTSLHQLSQQKPVIQLKNKLPPGVKIVMNKNNIGKIVLPHNMSKLDLGENSTKLATPIVEAVQSEENNLNYEDFVNDDLSYNNMTSDELKKLLKASKQEADEYKSKLEETEKQLEQCRERLKLYEE